MDKFVNLLEIIKHKDTAKRNGSWLESMVLAHLFIETQLTIIVSGHYHLKEIDETSSKSHVLGLGNLAKNKYLIREETFERIKEFNIARNKAVHGLTKGEITWEEIKEQINLADKLISELQRYYVQIEIGPEEPND